MEAKILELRRNRKKEIFGFLTFWFGRIFPEKIGPDREKVEKICLFVEGSLSFPEFWWWELRVLQGVCAFC